MLAKSQYFSRYAIAVISVIVATWIRLLLDPVLHDRVPFGIYFLAVMIPAWFGGLGPALLALALGTLAATHFFIPPDTSLMIREPADIVSLIVYVIIGLFFALVNESLRKAQLRAEASAAENARLNEELLQANRHKDEFIAMLAHELRNPLAPIRNALRVLQTEPANRETVSKMYSILDHQVQAIVRLVDDLLDLSRIKRGKIELRRETVNLSEVINRAIETVTPMVELEKHQLDVSLPTEPLWINADPVRMTQVFTNLLNNACRYTERGGQISLTAERKGQQAMVRCRDTGIGISPELLPRIFERFVQDQDERVRARGGLGIGLSLVQKLVQEHDGRVEASSEGPGKGSEFVVSLPLVAAPRRASTPKAETSLDSTGLRILVVDDSSDAAETLGMLLRLEGHDVVVVNDGPSALEAFQAETPDVILLDLEMPGMDGHEVARRIRALPEGKTTRLIALTGWGHEEERRRTQESGFDFHLLKPLDLPQLEELLSGPELVNKSRR